MPTLFFFVFFLGFVGLVGARNLDFLSEPVAPSVIAFMSCSFEFFFFITSYTFC